MIRSWCPDMPYETQVIFEVLSLKFNVHLLDISKCSAFINLYIHFLCNVASKSDLEVKYLRGEMDDALIDW